MCTKMILNICELFGIYYFLLVWYHTSISYKAASKIKLSKEDYKMKKMRRLAAIGAATVLAAGLLAGCWRAAEEAVLLLRRQRRQTTAAARKAAEAMEQA